MRRSSPRPGRGAPPWRRHSTADCARAKAACTADGNALAYGLFALVPLTAEWVDGSWPAAHSGAGTTFTRRVQFSEDVAVSYLELPATADSTAAVALSGGLAAEGGAPVACSGP